MTTWPAIPGETPIDPSHLRLEYKRLIRTRAQLIPVEAENVRLAIVKYLSEKPTRRRAPFTIPWALRLNREMFGKVWTWAGEIRRVELNLGSPPWRVETDLYQLERDLRCWEGSDMPVVEQAARLHHRAVSIHPFLNGNGRWARLLANIWLVQHDTPVTVWPEGDLGAQTSPIRGEYIGALKEADRGDMAHLIELHHRYADSGNGAPPA